jgi:hypothetical protein
MCSVARCSVAVEALCCKAEGSRFETRLSHCIILFSIYLIFPAALGAGVDSASNRNEYQKQNNNVSGVECGRCVGLTTLPPSVR